jgi:hypothetical protein
MKGTRVASSLEGTISACLGGANFLSKRGAGMNSVPVKSWEINSLSHV